MTDFGAVDYLVLVGMLVMSTSIGLFFAWKDRKNTDEGEFLRGGGNMATFPVCISILASFLPSTSFIGFPVVVYATGTQFWVVVLPSIIAAVLACELFIPIYYKMNLISVNQYLHQRFKSKNLQIIANISTLLAWIPFFGVEMFAPAIALSIVTDMSISSSICIIGIIVTLYTSMGGLKGVIWTDFFQFSIMLFGIMAVIVRGANISGGMAKSFSKAYLGGRIEFWNMEFDIYSMNSFWIFFFGFTILWSGTFATSQLQVQRAVCMPSLKSAKIALYCAVPGFVFIISLTVLAGVVMYARYYDCDPMLTGRVTRPDQLLPFFVMDIFEDDYKGLPGMFVACIFGSSLSTLSSGLNGMASIIWDDYAKKIFLKWVPEKYSVYMTKLLAAAIGVISIALAFGIKESKNIVEAAISIYGASVGPMFAVFCLGVFFPWANKWGAGSALIIGQIMCLWITIGAVSEKRNPATMMLGLSTEACADKNITVYMPGAPVSILTHYKIPDYDPKGMDALNHISPYFVPTMGFLISLIIGNIISFATKGNRDRKVDKDLIHFRVCRLMEKILPQNWRQFQEETPPSPDNRALRPVPNEFAARNGSKSDVVRERKYSDCEDPDDKQSAVPLRSMSIDRTTNL